MTINHRNKNFINNSSGQAIVETLLVIVLFTAITFAAIQLCILVVNDLIFNEAAFSSIRSVVVSDLEDDNQVTDVARNTANRIISRHINSSRENIENFNVTVWAEDPLGQNERDYSGTQIKKYNTNIEYTTKIMFASLLNPFNNSSFFGGGIKYITQTARARMIKSPDEEYYNKAYPGASAFSD